MKKLFTSLVILPLLHLASYGQSGMNISGSLVKVQADTYLIMDGDLKISNTNGLTIKPDAFVTTKGDLNLDNAPEALIVESENGGTGSYIVNGTVSHSGNGTARIQTFIREQLEIILYILLDQQLKTLHLAITMLSDCSNLTWLYLTLMLMNGIPFG